MVYKFKKQDLISFWEVKSVTHITRNGDYFIFASWIIEKKNTIKIPLINPHWFSSLSLENQVLTEESIVAITNGSKPNVIFKGHKRRHRLLLFFIFPTQLAVFLHLYMECKPIVFHLIRLSLVWEIEWMKAYMGMKVEQTTTFQEHSCGTHHNIPNNYQSESFYFYDHKKHE